MRTALFALILACVTTTGLAQLPPSELTQLLNPVDYGAIPNDGQDDGFAFEFLMQDVVEGTEIVIPSGTWELGVAHTCRMHVAVNHVTIRGAGRGQTILKYTSLSAVADDIWKGSCIYIGYAHWGFPLYNVTVRDLTIQDISTDPNVYGSSALGAVWTSDLTYLNVEILDGKGSNFQVFGGGWHGPPGRWSARNFRMEGCRVGTTEGGFSNASAMTIGGWDGVTIRGNLFEGFCYRGGLEGGEMHHLLFTENVVRMEYRDGFENGGGFGNIATTDAIFSKNHITSPHRACLAFNSDGDSINAGAQVLISDNIFRSFAEGVHVQSSNGGLQQNYLIRNNLFMGTAYPVNVHWSIPLGVFEVSNNILDGEGIVGLGEFVAFDLDGAPGIPLRSENQLIILRHNTAVNSNVPPTWVRWDGTVLPNWFNPEFRITNFAGWLAGTDRRVLCYGNKIGRTIYSSATHAIDGNTPDPDPRLADPLDLPPMKSGDTSDIRTVTISGLLPGDHVTWTSEAILPPGANVHWSITEPRDHDHDEKKMVVVDGERVHNPNPTPRINQLDWFLKNESGDKINPPPTRIRFWVERR